MKKDSLYQAGYKSSSVVWNKKGTKMWAIVRELVEVAKPKKAAAPKNNKPKTEPVRRQAPKSRKSKATRQGQLSLL